MTQEKEEKTFYKYYFLMLASMFLRLFWLVFREPYGMQRAAQKNPGLDSVGGLASHSIPFVVYPSMIILVTIIIGAILKKKWAYIGGFIFGAVHLVLVISLVVIKVSPGYGPAVVMPASALMMVFTYLTHKKQFGYNIFNWRKA